MIHLFCGFDYREAVGYHVFADSVIERASVPVALVPLHANGLPSGSNAFTLSRFLVPYLMGYKGRAIFADAADMLMLGDVGELAMRLDRMTGAAAVVKRADYVTRHPVKYVGTEMESPNTTYPRKNWASLMLIDCEHPAWRWANPHTIAERETLHLLQLRFLADKDIEPLDDCWNRLVDEGDAVDGAKVLHWTAGIPAFDNYRDAPGAELWWTQARTCRLATSSFINPLAKNSAALLQRAAAAG